MTDVTRKLFITGLAAIALGLGSSVAFAQSAAKPGAKAPDFSVVDVDGTPMQGLVAHLSATPGRIRWAGRPAGADTDEILAGLGSSEVNEMIGIIRSLTKSDITIVIIEHDMHVVFSLADRITVLAQGTPLVEDAPENIKGHPKVQEAYLGEAH